MVAIGNRMSRRRTAFRCTALAFGVCGFVSLGLTPGDEPGYLPVVGPPPLRFRAVTKTENLRPLPPLPLPEVAASQTNQPAIQPPESITGAPPSNTAQNMVEISTESPPEESLPFDFLTGELPTEMSPGPRVDTSAAAIVGLLTAGTNGATKYKILVPAFVPPRVQQPTRSSRATYETR